MGDLANARTVNGDFLITQTESGWQNQRSFKDHIQRIDEKLNVFRVLLHVQLGGNERSRFISLEFNTLY